MSIIKALGSLAFAIFLIAGLAVILTFSTVLESLHGTPFAQKNFYQAHWFDFFLGLVWLNIFCATLTRYPFKKKHTGYVITHLGILILLIGCLLTRLMGIEGQMTLFEQEANGRMTQPGFSLRISLPGGGEKKIDLKAEPLRRRTAIPLPADLPFQLDLLQIVPHALTQKSLEEDPASETSNHALKATLSSNTLGIKEAFTLIENDPSEDISSSKNIGPATFLLKTKKAAPENQSIPTLRLVQKNTGKIFEIGITGDVKNSEWKETGLTLTDLKFYPKARVENNRLVNLESAPHLNPAVEFAVSDHSGHIEHHTRFSFFPEFNSLRGGATSDVFNLTVELEMPPDEETEQPRGPSFEFYVDDNGQWFTRTTSTKKGTSAYSPLKIKGPIETGWMDMAVVVEQTFDHAKTVRSIKEDPTGKSETPMIELAIQRKNQPEEIRKLLIGQSILLGQDKVSVRISSEPKTAPLPFSLWLRDFRKIDYPGTSNAESYESDVTLRDPQNGVTIEKTIKMNKPLDYQGFRVFQASFIQDEHLGEASVFSIAKNPGMPLIYGGAGLIFVGVILLFYFHPFFNKAIIKK